MPLIQQLPSHIADLIAAGEVVERFPLRPERSGSPLMKLKWAEINPAHSKILSFGTKCLTPQERRAGRPTKGVFLCL